MPVVLSYSFNAVAPMFVAMALGAVIAKRGLAGDREIGFLNTLCFRYLLALHIFNNVLHVDFYAEFKPRLVVTFIIIVTALFVFSWLIFSLAVKDYGRRCICIATAYRSNNLIYALPLAANLFGPEGVKPAAMLVPFTIIFYNFFTVIVMVYHRQKIEEDTAQNNAARTIAARRFEPVGGAAGSTVMRTALKKCAFEVITNPLIIGSSLGIVFSLLRFPLPAFVRNGVNLIALSATPVSLVLLGAQINLKALAGNIRAVIGASALRLILVPGLVVPLVVALGFRGPELGALAVAFAAPPAVTNLIMARNYHIAPEFAAQTVYLSTILSMATIFAMVAVLRGLGLF
ncbi:MAG: AEC family transporter [Spirochaetaceae bacterium]|nr:AEC family transporter [Spirochaetaceae bacterium]